MSFTARPPQTPPSTGSRRPSPLLLTLIAVLALVALFVVFAQIYTEVLWFRQLDRFDVFATEWVARSALFGLGFVLMAVPVWYMLWSAHRGRPTTVPSNPREIGRAHV